MTPEGWLTFELNPWEANYTLSDLYDCVGNRTLSTENGVATSYAYDGANQLQASGNATEGMKFYTYDAAGNLHVVNTSQGRTTYTWGADSRLVNIQLPSGAVTTNKYRAGRSNYVLIRLMNIGGRGQDLKAFPNPCKGSVPGKLS